ncbi:MAG TPA: isochorismatase family protein [Polyangiaceae bacterium]|nr:isochorismatase family protein [Polyangiaceae bacterium]
MEVSFRLALRGSYFLLDAPADERPLAIELEAHARPLRALARGPNFGLGGEIDARGFADARPLDGTLAWASPGGLRALRYNFAFSSNEGRPHRFAGRSVLLPGARLDSLSSLSGSFFDGAGAEVGRLLARVDLRRGVGAFLRSWRLRFLPPPAGRSRARPRLGGLGGPGRGRLGAAGPQPRRAFARPPMTPPTPSSSVLVIIDVQERLVPALLPEAMAEVHRSLNVLLEAAQRLSVPVLATEQYPRGLGPTLGPLRERLEAVGAPRPIEKATFSAMGEPAFAAALAGLGRRHVVLVGVEAHVCVALTARDLLAAGYEVLVPFDGVASRRDDHRRAGLGLCERAGALVTTSETVAFDWLGRAGTDAFRAVSKAVR